ncbi:MAG: Gfo/Idh/MocA family oxidoreductase [Anaerolineae bacterium]|nr:Gfo/Idh/MocA family oxidoreductase [Anaerolineae bacterium]MDW8100002.1 Gfo/Idh/MocA family oxidoreductase [Anaerolineae bacterium]
MGDQVRIGIIGVGQIGKHHLRQYQEIPEAEIVAVADIREDEARRVAQEFGVPYVYTDYRELLQRDDIQSVDVCLHNRLHAPVTIAALQAGKNVYCEKPMAWTYCEAKEMYDTARRLGRMLHIQLNTLYTPEARAAKRLIDDGRLGEIYYAKSSHYRRRGRPFVDGYGSAQFVQRSAAGGGAMLDMAVYHIARMMWLLGNPAVKTVSGTIYQKLDNMYEDRRRSSGYDVEELGMGLVRLEGGITYFIEEAWAIHSDQPDGDHIFGSKAGLRIEPLAYFTTFSDLEMDATFDVKTADWRWHQCDPTTAGFDHSQRHWVWAQLGRVPLLDTAGLALKTAEITEGIYLSSHLGREVTADEIAQADPATYR